VESRSVRVGTWNVEYAAGEEKNAARLERLLAADCDVLVLTETNDALALPAPYVAVSSDQRPTAAAGGRWVTIWSRLPARQLATNDPVRTAAAELAGAIVVYGTVLPWHTDPGPTPADAAPAPNWSEFMRVTALQGAEWRALRDRNPDSLFIVAGDLNQSLGAQHYYGTQAGRQLLRDCLMQAGLTCLTDGEHLPQGLLRHPLIDHICAAAPAGEVIEGEDWVGWEGAREGTSRLSDHSGVAVTLRSTPGESLHPGGSETMSITIAGKRVPDPFERLAAYASRYSSTLIRYDLAGQDEPFTLSRDEVRRTRKIASRISDRERDWFVERGQTAPWTQVEADADLGDADPEQEGGLYDRADALYQHFRSEAPRNVNMAKISKVLHLKRPALVPLLDSHLEREYRSLARQAARRYPARGYSRLYWAAIRDDLLLNRDSIAALRSRFAKDDREAVRRLSQLTDLRVLDILTW
jgi:hypothetical protein